MNIKWLTQNIIFFLFIVVFSSCNFNGGEKLSFSTGTKIINDLVDSSSKEKTLSGENIDDFFKNVNFTEESSLSNKDDFGADITDPTFNEGSYYYNTGVSLIYHVVGNIPFSRENVSYNGKNYSKSFESGDYFNEFAILLDNSISFDSISFKANPLEYFYTDNGLQFSFFFDESSIISKSSSKLKNIFQYARSFYVNYAYVLNKKDGPIVRVFSNFLQSGNSRDNYVFKWRCLTSDWTFETSNFRDQSEIFALTLYSPTLTGYVLDKLGNCISGMSSGLCNLGTYTASGSDFANGVLRSPKFYGYSGITSVQFTNGQSLCSINDNLYHSGTTSAECWNRIHGAGSRDTRGRVVFRPRRFSFCVPEPNLSEKDRPKLTCNLERQKDITYEVFSDTGVLLSKTGTLTCWDEYMPGWNIANIGKWRKRACLVEDFRCRGADYNCGGFGTCWLGCGPSNSEPQLRPISDCDYSASNGYAAFMDARNKCPTITFTLASTGSDICMGDPSTAGCGYARCSGTSTVLTVLGCSCDNASSRWTYRRCSIPPAYSGCGCTL